MAIFIDPPLWPAHGTLFSHLISDTSIQELHLFATTAGISSRAFDRDHYDVPERRYAELVAQGAIEVDGRTLVRTLLASGLRIPARQRSSALALPLLSRWNTVLPGTAELGQELVARWGEPHRRYHDRTHLLEVIDAIEMLIGRRNEDGEPPAGLGAVLPAVQGAEVRRTVLLAAWFHDAVHTGAAGSDEKASARLASERLTGAGLPKTDVEEVARLVRLTENHAPKPGDTAGALLCDADLAVLGRPALQYRRYLQAVRAEYQHVPEDAFIAGRAAVVRQLLESDPLFSTPQGRALWESSARDNLRSELQR